MIFFAFSHFLVIIFVINIFCIIQTLRQVYSHIKGERLTILDLFFIFYYHHINHIKLKKRHNLWSNDSKHCSSGHSVLLQKLNLSTKNDVYNRRTITTWSGYKKNVGLLWAKPKKICLRVPYKKGWAT